MKILITEQQFNFSLLNPYRKYTIFYREGF